MWSAIIFLVKAELDFSRFVTLLHTTVHIMHCSFNWHSRNGDIKIIRLTIFLITSVCVGFPALLWALSVLFHHRKCQVRISAIVVFLLVSDLLELILIPVFVPNMFQEDPEPCKLIFTLLSGVRLCGHLLHQMVAIENISQQYPTLAKVFSRPCSITLCIIMFLLSIGCQFLFEIRSVVSMFVCALPVIVTYLLTWKAPNDDGQPTDRKPGVLVLTVAMFTLIVLYMPFFLNILSDIPFMLDSLVSLRLISDPLLCVLVCRELGYNYTHTCRSRTALN